LRRRDDQIGTPAASTKAAKRNSIAPYTDEKKPGMLAA
jgi:hypothetical protein